MAYTAGVFTASQYGDQLIKESELLGEGSRMTELKQPIVAGAAILMHQDPNVVEKYEGQRCIGAKLTNIRAASTLRANTTLVCDLPAGVEAGSDSLNVTKQILCKPAAFTIWDSQCRNAYDAAEQTAYMSAKAKIDLEIELTSTLVALLESNADSVVGLATHFESVTPTENVDTLEIAAANFTSDLVADFTALAQIVDMNNAIILNGRNLYNDAINAQFQGAACCDNDTILNSNQYFSMFWDLKNVTAANTYLVDKNALLFWSSPLYTNTVPVGISNDTFVWTDMLPRLKYMSNGVMNDIYIDVRAKRVCSIVNGDPAEGWNYEYVLRGAMTPNMSNQDDRNGIIKIAKT